MSSEKIYITDRSAAETDDTCGWKFYLNRIEGGIGVVPAEDPIYFKIGRETHEDLAKIAEMPDISAAAIDGVVGGILNQGWLNDKDDVSKLELTYRRVGWLTAFALFIEPQIRAKYNNVHIEKEIILDRTPLWVACTPDRLLEDKESGALCYKEWKSVKYANAAWVAHWQYAIQLHIGIKAAMEELNRPIAFGQVMGLVKGQASKDGHLSHPYVWGYHNEKKDQWSCSWDDGKKSGWALTPVWKYPFGVVSWVKKVCGPEVAKAQFPHSAPVFLNERMLDGWVEARTHRETRIEFFKSAINDAEVLLSDDERSKLRNTFFPKRLAQCRPQIGSPCEYLMACWNAETASDPCGKGVYVPRVPHHEVEIISKREKR